MQPPVAEMIEESPRVSSTSPSTPTVPMITSPTEETPLLTDGNASEQTTNEKSGQVIRRILLTSFLVSLSFGVTQVPLIYVIGIMTCDEYYKTHSLPPPSFGNRCRVREIEFNTAQSVALVAAGTTLFGVFNLFVTGWTMKALGLKKALLLTIGFPAVRLAVQNVGVQIGAGWGVFIIQASQFITVVGGPAGYILALNSFAAEMVEPAQRTATLGRLSGSAMFGTALGYLVGGYLGDIFGIIMPFRVTFALFTISLLYAAVALPGVKSVKIDKSARSLAAFFDPLRLFVPSKWILTDGKVQTEYGVSLLGVGVFLGVLATSYITVLLQMYSTDVFDWGTKENGWLISINSLVRGVFLTFAFPPIISAGRAWLDRRQLRKLSEISKTDVGVSDLPVAPQQISAIINPSDTVREPTEPPKSTSDNESFAFDLWFTKYSLIADGLLTGLATFTTEGWQLYIIAVILPLASGTGPAAKGTILQMCSASQRTDALSAISLVELVARLTSTAVFGFVFSLFAGLGVPNLTFTCNAAIAIVGFVILMFVRSPPEGASRWTAEDVAACENSTTT